MKIDFCKKIIGLLLAASILMFCGCSDELKEDLETNIQSDYSQSSRIAVNEFDNSSGSISETEKITGDKTAETASDKAEDLRSEAESMTSSKPISSGQNEESSAIPDNNSKAISDDTDQSHTAETSEESSKIAQIDDSSGTKENSYNSQLNESPEESSKTVSVSDKKKESSNSAQSSKPKENSQAELVSEKPKETSENSKSVEKPKNKETSSEVSEDKTESFYGVLIDEDCSDFEDPPMHDLPCMLMYSCRDSGYGLDILQEDGTYKFYMFDDNGQKLAWDYLNKTTRMYGLYVTVTGIYEDGVIKVKTFKES